MKNSKGITLIALVITIIVLLILAGVSIAMLTGENGILTQANNSKAATSKAEAVERINLALNAVKAEIYSQQVTNKAYKPVAKDAALVAILAKDAITATAEADATYWYELTADGLTISYKNTADNVTTVSGSIDFTATGYPIDKAE